MSTITKKEAIYKYTVVTESFWRKIDKSMLSNTCPKTIKESDLKIEIERINTTNGGDRRSATYKNSKCALPPSNNKKYNILPQLANNKNDISINTPQSSKNEEILMNEIENLKYKYKKLNEKTSIVIYENQQLNEKHQQLLELTIKLQAELIKSKDQQIKV